MDISAGDTAWLLVSTALVMLMTPALGFFYAGLVGRRNALSTLLHSFFILCLISVQFVLWGYTLAFGPTQGGIIGKVFQVEDKTVTLDLGGGNKVRIVKGQVAGSWSDATGTSEKDTKEKK